MNPTSAVSVAFDPAAALGDAGRRSARIGLVLVLLGLRAGARGTLLAAGLAGRRAGRRSPTPR